METILAKALGQDVTQLASAEKQRLLARLLGRLAHEIRNPLSSLDIHVQLLEEDLRQLQSGSRDKLLGRLEIVHGELHRLETIVKQFLRLAGPSEMTIAPVNLRNIVSHVCDLLAPEAAAREIHLQMHTPPKLPDIHGDSVQLTQVFLNLVINALQAVGPGGQIDVRATESESAVLVTVSDTGPGVPHDKAETIFEPYFTTKPGGSGLGLWIVQQIVTAHGGDIELANRAEGGAVFAVRLPLRDET